MAHHHYDAPKAKLRAAVLSFSDTRDESNDQSGKIIKELLTAEGHTIAHYAVVREDTDEIRRALSAALGDASVQLLVTTGGTGISLRDMAYEGLTEHLVKRLDGFGEIFRMLSFAEVGSAAMASRAVGGITATGQLAFALPGSSKAVTLGMTRLILPEVNHLYREVNKHHAQ